MAFALTPEREKRVDELLSQYPTKRAALLPVLWLCQEQNGWIAPDVIDFVGARLELSTAAVKGVVTFYTMFFDKPVGENVVWVCRTIGCDIRGGKAIQEHLEKRLGCHAGETTKDGKFTLLRAECLAACGQAPMIQINDEYFENLDLAAVDRIVDSIQSGELKPARVSVLPTPAPIAPSITRTSIPSARPASIPPASSSPASGSTKLPSIPPPASGSTKLPSIAPPKSSSPSSPSSVAMSAQPAKPSSIAPPRPSSPSSVAMSAQPAKPASIAPPKSASVPPPKPASVPPAAPAEAAVATTEPGASSAAEKTDSTEKPEAP